MREKLKKLLAKEHKDFKPYQVENCVNKYVDAVMHEIAVQWATVTSTDIEQGEFSFGAEAVATASGQTKRQTNYKIMQTLPATSLVRVTYRGNNKAKRVSKVTFNQQFRKEIFKELIASEQVLTQSYLDELEAKANYPIYIDMLTLHSYIKHTRQALSKSPSQAYTEKLFRNLSAASQISQRAIKQSDGRYVVKEYWEEIDSGRLHGHGLSLQRVAKEVRHAALGHCWKIDFKASSYAIMTSLALAIDPMIKVEALKHYITYRASVRKSLARKIGISEEWMKTIFTAMGFGADLKNNPYSSIRKMLGLEKFTSLVANSEFADIKLALDSVRKVILNHTTFAGNNFEIGRFKYQPIDAAGKKRTNNQKLAWIYQACERMALEMVIEKMPAGYDMLLPVHDCLYIRQKLPSHVVLDLKDQLHQVFALLDFEQEQPMVIQAAIETDEPEHKRRMTEAEKLAVGYKSPNFETDDDFEKPDSRNDTDKQYELRRKRQFQLDLETHEKQKQQDADYFE